MIYKNKHVQNIYRVIPHLTIANDFPRDDKGEIEKSFDDYYIPCSRVKAEIYTTGAKENGKEVFVAYTPSRTVRNDLVKNLSKYIIKESNNDTDKTCKVSPKSGTYESDLYFYDCDIKHFAKILKARTKGAKIKPTDKLNLPHDTHKYKAYDNMPKDWFKEFKSLYSVPIQRKEKIKVSLVWSVLYKDFGKSIGVNILEDSMKENYKCSHYIHKIGEWEAFVEYLKERLKGDTT